MNGNIIMWTCKDEAARAMLKQALATATDPIRKAAKSFWWDGLNLVTSDDCFKDAWRHIYFYLSGYGDAEWQLTQSNDRRQPVAIPTTRKEKGTKQ